MSAALGTGFGTGGACGGAGAAATDGGGAGGGASAGAGADVGATMGAAVAFAAGATDAVAGVGATAGATDTGGAAVGGVNGGAGAATFGGGAAGDGAATACGGVTAVAGFVIDAVDGGDTAPEADPEAGVAMCGADGREGGDACFAIGPLGAAVGREGAADGAPVDGNRLGGALLISRFGCGAACGGCVTACCSDGGGCEGCGCGSFAYLANSACAPRRSLAPSIFCSFISFRQASMTGSAALRQWATASGNSVTMRSPRSTAILATAAA
jgi:hypothetical protein